MQIRREQMEAFREHFIGTFENQMRDHVCSFYPGEAGAIGAAAEVLEFVRRIIRRGQSLGFTSKRDLAALINIAAVYGEQFEVQSQEVQSTLRDPELEPSTRIQLALELLAD